MDRVEALKFVLFLFEVLKKSLKIDKKKLFLILLIEKKFFFLNNFQ
jgi:hypothetical protein